MMCHHLNLCCELIYQYFVCSNPLFGIVEHKLRWGSVNINMAYSWRRKLYKNKKLFRYADLYEKFKQHVN